MEKNHAHALRHYLVVWLGLIGLTAISFGASWLHLGTTDVVIALGIAVIKSVLVLLFFMHLIEHRGANALIIGVTVIFIALLSSLMAADVATRLHTTPRPVLGVSGAEPGRLRPAAAPHAPKAQDAQDAQDAPQTPHR